MKTNYNEDYSSSIREEWFRFLSNRFQGMNSLNVVLNLRQSTTLADYEVPLNRNRAEAIGRLFRNSMNKHFFGNKRRRFDIEIPFVFAVQEEPHWHIHAQIGLIEGMSKLKARTFCETFALKNPWIDRYPYVRVTRSDLGTQTYNSRFGLDTVNF